MNLFKRKITWIVLLTGGIVATIGGATTTALVRQNLNNSKLNKTNRKQNLPLILNVVESGQFASSSIGDSKNLPLLTQSEYNQLANNYISNLIYSNFLLSWKNSNFSKNISSPEQESADVRSLISSDILTWISHAQNWNIVQEMQWGKTINQILPNNFDISKTKFSNYYLNMNSLNTVNMQAWTNNWINSGCMQVYNQETNRMQIIIYLSIQTMPFYGKNVNSLPCYLYFYLKNNNFGLSSNPLLTSSNLQPSDLFPPIKISKDIPFENLQEYTNSLNKEIKTLKIKYEEFENKNKSNSSEINDLENNISIYKKKLSFEKAEYSNNESKLKNNEKEMKNLVIEINSDNSEISRKKSLLNKEIKVNESDKKEISQLHEEYLNDEKILEKIEKENDKESLQLSNSEKELQNTENRLSHLSSKIQQKTFTINKLTSENQILQNQVNELNNQVDKLEQIKYQFPTWKKAVIVISVLAVSTIGIGLVVWKIISVKNKRNK